MPPEALSRSRRYRPSRAGFVLEWAMIKTRRTGWLATGMAGFLAGLVVYASSAPDPFRHLALVVMIGAPVIAFWRLMKPRLAPHCPRPPEPGSPI